MNFAQTNLVNSYSARTVSLQKQINTIRSELASGNNNLTANQQDTVTKLSATVQSYATPQASISAALDTIAVAQKAITAIQPYITHMQQLASAASDPSTDYNGSTNFNYQFQQLVTEIGKLATGASLNSTNLLSGTAGMNVLLDPNNTAQSRFFINSVDIYGMMTMGILSGVKLDSPTDAQTALGSLNNASNQIMSKQFYLKLTADNLKKQASTLTSATADSQKLLDALQKVDQVKLKAQLAHLQDQQNIDYQLISQIDPATYQSLKLRNTIDSAQLNATASAKNALAAVKAAQVAAKAKT